MISAEIASGHDTSLTESERTLRRISPYTVNLDLRR